MIFLEQNARSRDFEWRYFHQRFGREILQFFPSLLAEISFPEIQRDQESVSPEASTFLAGYFLSAWHKRRKTFQLRQNVIHLLRGGFENFVIRLASSRKSKVSPEENRFPPFENPFSRDRGGDETRCACPATSSWEVNRLGDVYKTLKQPDGFSYFYVASIGHSFTEYHDRKEPRRGVA